jgi:hypothetical protein
MLNVAITDGYGNEIQRRLIHDWNYPIHRFLRWAGRDDKVTGRRSASIGWIDTMATNQMRLDVFRIALANQTFHVRDARCAEQIQAASLTPTGDAEDYRGHDDVLDAAMYGWIARDLERPRMLLNVDQTQRIQTPALLQMANDPQANFTRLWNDVQRFAKAVPGDPTGTILKHINGDPHDIYT